MDLVLNNLQRLIYHKTETNKYFSQDGCGFVSELKRTIINSRFFHQEQILRKASEYLKSKSQPNKMKSLLRQNPSLSPQTQPLQ